VYCGFTYCSTFSSSTDIFSAVVFVSTVCFFQSILNRSLPKFVTLSILNNANNHPHRPAIAHQSLFLFFQGNRFLINLKPRNIAVHIIANLPSFFTASFCFSFFIHHISSNLSAMNSPDFSKTHFFFLHTSGWLL